MSNCIISRGNNPKQFIDISTTQTSTTNTLTADFDGLAAISFTASDGGGYISIDGVKLLGMIECNHSSRNRSSIIPVKKGTVVSTNLSSQITLYGLK